MENLEPLECGRCGEPIEGVEYKVCLPYIHKVCLDCYIKHLEIGKLLEEDRELIEKKWQEILKLVKG